VKLIPALISDVAVPAAVILLFLLALSFVITGCSFVDEVGTALRDPTQLENVSDEAAAVAVGVSEGVETLARDPTITGAIGALIALVTAGGGYYLRRKLKKPKPATVD
jgi:hypothetical protein